MNPENTKTLAALAVLLTLLIATPSLAGEPVGWYGLDWDMSPAEVTEVFKKKGVTLEDNGYGTLSGTIPDWEGHGEAFINVGFKEGQLTGMYILIYPGDKNLPEAQKVKLWKNFSDKLVAEFTKKHGKPASKGDEHQWVKGKTRITISRMDEEGYIFTVVSYLHVDRQ